MKSRGRVFRPLFVVGLLVILHFGLVPWLGDRRAAPDFLLLALLVYSLRVRPGAAAAAGFGLGVLRDALASVAFGSGALAHTVVGYFAALGKSVFFADNILVNAGFCFGGLWLRDALLLVAGGLPESAIFWQLLVWSPIRAITTAVAGVVVLVIFRNWLDVRLTD